MILARWAWSAGRLRLRMLIPRFGRLRGWSWQGQAVMEQSSQDVPPGHVVQVLQQGFLIHDRVLRPASVIVAAAGG